jgi:hypothetical protein
MAKYHDSRNWQHEQRMEMMWAKFQRKSDAKYGQRWKTRVMEIHEGSGGEQGKIGTKSAAHRSHS